MRLVPSLLVCAVFACITPSRVAHAEGSELQEAFAVFRAQCGRCHGEDGRSDTPGARALKVRPMQNDAALAGLTRAEIVLAVKRSEKHAGVVELDGDDLQKAALAVMTLAKGGRAPDEDGVEAGRPE